MPRVGAIVTSCLLCLSPVLAGCSAASSIGGMFGGGSSSQPAGQWSLALRSEPPGAEARAPQGQSCRTPCELMLPMADTSVTFTLAGYAPETIPIKWLPATFHYEMYERTDQADAVYPTDFSPNPAIARFSGAAVAVPTPKSKIRKRTRATRTAPPQMAPAPQ